MGINDDDIQQIRNRVNLVDIIGEQVQLKKSGRTWRGLCPFHHENTPSFHIDPAKQLYHCFGCSAGGDVFTFLMKSEGLEFREAVEVLARKIGYTLKETVSAGSGIKNRLLQICEAATLFYEEQLAAKGGAAARGYLEKRGLTALSGPFRLGLSPDWESSIDSLKKQGFSDSEIIKAGVGARSQRGTVYDRFRGRLIFPITDSQGRPIAFGGRVLDDSMPKYLNSPETPLYHKGAVLYGLAQAKNPCIKRDTAIVVEGYTDLLALAGAGVTNTVASLGTAFTIDHLSLLSRFVAKIILVFDGDAAGLAAAERSIDYIGRQRLPGRDVLSGLIERIECELLVAVLPEKLDPADFIATRGADAFEGLTETAKPLISFLIDRIIERHKDKSSGHLIAANEAAKLVGQLPSPVAQEEYMRYLADRLDIAYAVLTQEIVRAKVKTRAPASAGPKSSGAEREFIKLLLHDPEKMPALNDVAVDQWQDPALRALAAVLKTLAAGKANAVLDSIHKIDPELRNLVSELLLEPIGGENSDDYFSEIFIKLKELTVERQIDILRKQLEKTDSRDKQYDDIFAELMSLEFKRRELKSQTKDGGSLWVKN